MRVLILSFNSLASGSTLSDAGFLAERGNDVTLLTTRVPEDVVVPDGVRVVESWWWESQQAIPRAERVLVLRGPRAIITFVRRAVSLGYKVPRFSRPTFLAVRAVRAAAVAQHEGSRLAHIAWRAYAYKPIRGWVIWRGVHRGLLDQLGVDSLDLVVVADSLAVPTGWHLAQLNPRAEVTLRLDRSRVPDADQAAAAEGVETSA